MVAEVQKLAAVACAMPSAERCDQAIGAPIVKTLPNAAWERQSPDWLSQENEVQTPIGRLAFLGRKPCFIVVLECPRSGDGLNAKS